MSCALISVSKEDFLFQILTSFSCVFSQSFKLEAAKGLSELCKDPAGLTKVKKS